MEKKSVKRGVACLISVAMVLTGIYLPGGGNRKIASAAVADDIASALLKTYDMTSTSGITFAGTGSTPGTVANGELTLPGGACGTQYAVLDADFSQINDGVTIAFKTKAGATDGYSPLFCFKWNADSWSSSDPSYSFDDNLNFWILRADLDTMGNVKSSTYWRDAAADPTLAVSKGSYDSIALTIDSSAINIYKNGTLFKSVTEMGGGTFAGLVESIKNNSPEFRLGNIKFWAAWNDYTGSYKDVSIYKRALTATEISYLVNGKEEKLDSLISAPVAKITDNQVEIAYTTDITPDSVEVTVGNSSVNAKDGKFLYTPPAAGEYEFTVKAKKEGYLDDVEKVTVKVAFETGKLVFDQELVEGLKVSSDSTKLSVAWTALNNAQATAKVVSEDGDNIPLSNGEAQLTSLTNKTTYTVTVTAKKESCATKTVSKTFTYKKGKAFEVLTGTKWWDAKEQGKDFAFTGDGTMILDVDYIGPGSDGAFSVELQDSDNKYITTGSDINIWGAGCGENYDYVDCIKQQSTPLTPGHKYRITIECNGNNFSIIYYDVTAKKQRCKMTSSACVMASNKNVHVMAQVGSFQVYKLDGTAALDLSADTLSVQKGKTGTLELTDDTFPTGATVTSVTSMDESVATAVVSSGKVVVTGKGEGTTTITATGSNGAKATCEVTVYSANLAVTSVTLNKQSASLGEGDTLTLVATVLPEDAIEKGVTWKSDNISIATVDATGKVTAVKAGNATITATSKENTGLSASCKVTVTEQSSPDDGNTGGGTVTDESKLGTYRSDLAYKRVGVHDPSIIQDPKTKRYYIFGSHCAWAWSDDLENWTAFTNNISEAAAETIFADEIAWCKKAKADYTVKGNMWAPDVIWNPVMKKWCMYMTINGPDWNSTISLLTADSLDGNWTYVGKVIQSGMSKRYGVTFDYQKVTGESTVNSRYTSNVSGGGNPTLEPHAIDACVLYDDNGDLWMSYGSWSGGISMIKLDKTTGLRDYSTKYADTGNAVGADGLITDPYTGYKIAGGGAVSGEGSYIKKIGAYYYLFLSYGGYEPKGGYNMRVFRASDIKGPYKDVANKDARTVVNGKAGDIAGTTGMRIISYYKWNFADYGYTAQGHNSATVDADGKAYVVYHNKFNDGTAAHEVRVHQLLTNKDGWILAAPFEYAGETVKDTGYTQKAITGDYGIMFQKQNVDHAKLACTAEQKIRLEAGTATATGYKGNITGDCTGTWESETGSPYVTLTIGNTAYKGVFCEGTIDETDVKAMTFTAVGSNQECLWGYKVNDPTVAIRMTMDKVIRIPNTVATDIPLPTTGVGGSTITWRSNSVAIADDGSVPHLFDEDSKVSMTATITNNGYEYSKVYEFTVPGNTKLSSDSDVVLKTFYTDTELDMSRLQTGKCPKVDNPFYYTHEDISEGATVSFDIVRTAASDRLSNIISFNNKLGKLYFTGGSYLGYNDFNDHYMDANLNANFLPGEDYLLDNIKVNIKIEILSSGFNVYQNGTKVYSSAEVKMGTVPGGFSNNNPETTILSWLKTAPELNFGSGNFWNDLIFKGKISDVVCSYKQPAMDVNGSTVPSLSGLYTQDYESVQNISTEWKSPNAQEYVSLDSVKDEHGKYALYDLTGAPSTVNSRGAHSYFGDSITWPDNYILEYDMSLKAGNGQESQVAVVTSNVAYVSNNENYGIDSGYVFKMTSTNSETWAVNGGSTVTIPKSTWVHFILTGAKNSAAAHLKITNGNATLFDQDITAADTGTVKGMYVLAGRYNATYKVDNIVVKEPGVDYVDRTAFDKILVRAEQYVVAQEQNAIYSAASFQALKDAIATAKSTVTNTSAQEIVNAQAEAVQAAITGLERLSYTVTVANAENGSVTGLAAGGKYYSGDSMSLTAVPDSGYTFGGWKIGDEVVSENTTYSAMVTENITITPIFTKSGSETPEETPDPSEPDEPSGQDIKLMEGLIAEYLFNGDLIDSKNPSKEVKIISSDADNESKIVKDMSRGNVMEMRGTWQATGYMKFDTDYVDKISDAFTITMWAKAGNSKAGENGKAAAPSSLFNFKTTQDTWSEDAYAFGFVSLDTSLHPWINDGKGHWVDRPKNDEELNLSADKWQQVTMCIDGANNKILMYVDGALTETVSALGEGTCAELLQSIKDNTTEIQIGTFLPWWNVWDFRGYVDDVRMYNRVLTAEDVSALYAKGADKSVIVNTTQEKYTLSYDSSVSNASVNITKDGNTFASGSKVVINDQIKLSITPEKGFTFAEPPVVTADNAIVNVAEVKDGVYTYFILNFKGTTKLKINGAAVPVQYAVSIADEAKKSAEAAGTTLSLSTSDATAASTVQLVITPDEGKQITSAAVTTQENSCTVSEPEKGANGIWIFNLSGFKGDTVIKSVTVETAAVKVSESGTNTALNIGAANLGETDFADKDLTDSILTAVTAKDSINTIINEETGEEIAAAAMDSVIADINKAVNGNSNVNVFVEVNEETELDDSLESTVNNTLLKEMEKQAVQGTNNTVASSKAAIPLDISFYAKVSGVDNMKISIKDTGNKEVTIKMAVPSHIEKEADSIKRLYYIVRFHGKEQKIIPCTYNKASNTVAFKSSKFSTYVLCYVDTTNKKETGGDTNPGGGSGSGGGAGGGGGFTPSAPVTTPSASPTVSPSSKPTDTTPSTPPADTDTPTAPTVQPSQEPTKAPEETKQPSDDDNKPDKTPSSVVKKGNKVVVKKLKYTVLSAGKTRTVRCTGIKSKAKNKMKSVVIPASVKISGKKYKVTEIAKNAFKGNKKITKITIGKNVSRIGKNAFKGCSSLKSIVIKSKKLTAKKTGSNAFKGINSKATVKAPKGKIKAYKKLIRSKGAGKKVKVKKLK